MKNPAWDSQVVEWAESKSEEELRTLLDEYAGEMDVELREDWFAQWFYIMLRQEGTAPVWAAMTATGHGTRMNNSEGAFFEHARKRMENWSPWQKKSHHEAARKAGISTQGKVHVGGLGAPDNPDSWVSGTDDIRAVAKKRNLTIKGHINHQGQAVPPKHVPLAPDLVEEMVSHERSQDPDLDRRCSRDETALRRLRGLVTEKYGVPASKAKLGRDPS